MKLLQVFYLAGLILLVGCVQNTGTSTVPKNLDGQANVNMASLIGQKFEMVELDGKPVVLQGYKLPTLSFGADARIFGQVCNVFNGSAKIEKGILKADGMISTRMFCSDPKLNELEFLFFNMANEGAEINIMGNELSLEQGERVLRYKRVYGVE